MFGLNDFRESNSLLENVNMEEQKSGQESGKQGQKPHKRRKRYSGTHPKKYEEKYKELSRIRNGVETIPSILWRKYQIDHMPVRGLLPTKLRFGIKLAALNFKKLFGYLNSVGQCALIPQIS